MAKRVQRFRTTSTVMATLTGLVGELIVNLTRNSVHLHDGVTPGGFELARADASNIQDATTNQNGRMTTAQVVQLNDHETRITDNESDIADHETRITTNEGDIADLKVKVTFPAPISKPAAVTNHGFLYTKDVASKAELFWLDEDDNEVQLTSAGSALPGFASGDELVWRGASPPSGWSVQAIDQKAIKIVSGSPGADGGGADFDSVFSTARTVSGTVASHVLTASESGLPAHSVFIGIINGSGSGTQEFGDTATPGTGTDINSNVAAQDAASGHVHGWSGSVNLNVRHREFNIIKKT